MVPYGIKTFYKKIRGLEIKTNCILVLSAVLNALALMYVNYLLAWLALSCLFYASSGQHHKHHLRNIGFVFGALSGLILNFWMVPVVFKYAQGSIFIAFACWVASAVVLALSFGLQFYIFNLIKIKEEKFGALITNSLLMASLWVLVEWGRAEIFSGIPWLSYSIGITKASDLFLIQLAAYGGVYILSFLIIFSAHIIGYLIIRKQWKLLCIPVLIIGMQFILGFLLHRNYQDEANLFSNNKFSAAIIMAGLPPETTWNENSADMLVQKLFSLNRRAVAQNPDLIVWTETIVPWTYAPDDDFIKEITKENSGKKTHTMIGMNSALASSGDVLSNSAYLLTPEGNVSSRYDKQLLLSFVEKPLLYNAGRIILPFLGESGMKMQAGKFNKAIDTPWGKAGMLLCNESTYSSLAAKTIKNGASYLVNMGNDSWFSDYFITRQHFYNSRLRAVEVRKDIIINNNMGVCGLVKSSGEINSRYDGKVSGVHIAEVTPNNFEAGNPQWFVVFILFVILIIILNKMYLMFKINVE